MTIADINAEKALVGACFLSGETIPSIMAVVGVEDFHFPTYRLMYGAIADLSMKSEPITPATIAAHLSSQRSGYESFLDAVGGSAAITSTIEGADLQEWPFWVRRVRQMARLRDLNRVAEDAIKLASEEPEDVDAAFAKVEESLAGAAFRGSTASAERIGSDALQARIDKYIDDPDSITGLETGWGVFDRELDGFEPGNVTIVYAPPSQFKSMFVQNIGYRFALRGHAGLWFTTEMPKLQVEERVLQLHSGLNLRWLRHNHGLYPHRKVLQKKVVELADLPITIIDKTSLDVGRVRAEIQRQRRWGGIEYVIVDLVDHVVTRRHRDDETANQAAVMLAMKDIAKSNDVHVILTKHIVKRDKSQRTQSNFDPEDMRGSSAYHGDVDCAVSLAVFDWDSAGKPVGLTKEQIASRKMDGGQLNIMAWIAKNRGGDTGPHEFTIDLRKGGQIQPMHALQWVQSAMPSG